MPVLTFLRSTAIASRLRFRLGRDSGRRGGRLLTLTPGGGLWHPEAAPIAAMRRDIDRHPRRIKDVLLDAGMRREFLGNVAKSDAKAVKAFVSGNSENALKVRPKVRVDSFLNVCSTCLMHFVRPVVDWKVLGRCSHRENHQGRHRAYRRPHESGLLAM
jgi:hypothetical protein